jgi:hypothetical protein
MLKGFMTKRSIAAAAVLGVAAALFVAVAAATSTTTVNPANAPSGTHFANGSTVPVCTVSSNQSVSCTGTTLGGVGHTDATVLLVANYSGTVNCYNPDGHLVESHTTTFSTSSSTTVTPTKNGQLTIPPRSTVSPSSVPQTCPNPNWTPQFAPGSPTLTSFTYTVTFAGFSGPYITITGNDP